MKTSSRIIALFAASSMLSTPAVGQTWGQILSGAGAFEKGRREAEARELEARRQQLNIEALNRAERNRRYCQTAPLMYEYVGIGASLVADGDSVRIKGIDPTSPAARAGLEMGDRLVSINDSAVTTLDGARAQLFGGPIYSVVNNTLQETGNRQLVGTTVLVVFERLNSTELVRVRIPRAVLRSNEDLQQFLRENNVDCSPAGLQAPQTVYAPQSPPDRGKLEKAWNTRTVNTGDYSIKRCFYKTVWGYEFEVNHRDICPYTVKINPETNTVYFD